MSSTIGLLISERYHELFQADLHQLQLQLRDQTPSTDLSFILLPGAPPLTAATHSLLGASAE